MSGDPWPIRRGLATMSDDEFGRRCEALLDDPVIAEVMNQLDADALMKWRSSSNPAEREDAWQRVAVIADIRRALNSVVESLKLRTLRERRKAVPMD